MLHGIAIFLGGGMGAALRWLVTLKIHRFWGTFTVNVLGAFLIGVLYQYIAQHPHLRPAAKLFLMTGLLGGFTTFSTYILDFVNLYQSGRMSGAVLYLVASVCVGVLALLAGMRAGAWIG